MAVLQLFRQDDFTGGLNLRADQFKLAPNESPDMLNVEVDPRGGLFSRGAMRRINPEGVLQNFLLTEADENLVDENGNFIGLEANPYWHPRSMFAHYADTHYLMLSTGKVDSLVGSVYYSVGANFTKLNVDVQSSNGACFASWGKDLYFTTGKGYKTHKWDGTTLTPIAFAASDNISPDYVKFENTTAHIPSAEHIAYHAGRLFVANVMDYTVAGGVPTPVNRPNLIRWSDLNNPTKWVETNRIEIFGSGDQITSIVPFGGALVIFKRLAVYVLTGDGTTESPFAVQLVTNKVGAATHEAVAVTERGIYFFCWPDGLFVFTGDGVIDLFEPIRPILLRGEVNPDAVDEIFVSFINRRIWVSLPYSASTTVGRASVSFVYDPSINGFSYMGESYGVDDAFKASGTWVKHQTADGWGVACGLTFARTDGSIIHAAAHSAKDVVLNVDVPSFETDNIDGMEQGFTTYYRTRWVDGENYSQKKMWRRPDFVLRQEASARILDFRVFHDYEESLVGQKRQFDVLIPASGMNALWGAFNWGEEAWGTPNEGSFVKSGQNLGLARAVQLEIVGQPGLSWGLDSMTLKYNGRRVKG